MTSGVFGTMGTVLSREDAYTGTLEKQTLCETPLTVYDSKAHFAEDETLYHRLCITLGDD